MLEIVYYKGGNKDILTNVKYTPIQLMKSINYWAIADLNGNLISLNDKIVSYESYERLREDFETISERRIRLIMEIGE